ncbi:uncharacterized protein N7511_004852 [Penicillium nucicola]|uniref:uncharacterized protein n=1 Tax=Penicillium nucicola TaxID=1850975 RepID=UPI00254597D0|nr:uncharacterized protein N7511_004852 [Penicillium nucicola]KAJ5767236.1 hypothetical protein N7511_004852 [Penicillium nucicola]
MALELSPGTVRNNHDSFLNNADKNMIVSNDTTAFMYSMDKKPELDLHLAHSHRGREVSAYLSYVIDYYDNLPPYSIFIHAGAQQRHNDLFGPDTSVILQNLRHEAIEAKGYLNLRCMHSPGCPTHVAPNHPSQADIEAGDARAHFAQIYRELFGMKVVVPDYIGAPCCAQFAVSRKQIQQRPKSEYVHMMNWVDGASAQLIDSYAVGWVFESLWHVVFGMDAIE